MKALQHTTISILGLLAAFANAAPQILGANGLLGGVTSTLLPNITTLLSNFTTVTYLGSASRFDMPAHDEYHGTEPEAVGFDRNKLKAALSYAAVDGSFSIKVFRHGCLVGQGFRDTLDDRIPSLNAGQTKAVVALVAGIVADRGWIDLDAPIDRYVEPGLGDAAHRNRTIRDFMTLVSGV